MNRTARRQKRKREPAPRPTATPPTSDRAIYIGIFIVGFFAVMLGGLFTDLLYVPHVILAYLLVVAYLINISAFKAYRGKPLSNLGASLARIPLRFVGYGTKDGKPLEAAHDHPETRKALLFSVVISILVLVALAVILLPGVLHK